MKTPKTENSLVTERKTSWSGAFFSPRYFLVRAMMLAALFAMLHLAGLREHTTFLSGTVESTSGNVRISTLYGISYLVLYMGSVIAAPIFALAAGLMFLWEKWSFRKK